MSETATTATTATSALRSSELFRVAGRVALVTGGSRGIGAMMAEALAVNGAKVCDGKMQAAAP